MAYCMAIVKHANIWNCSSLCEYVKFIDFIILLVQFTAVPRFCFYKSAYFLRLLIINFPNCRDYFPNKKRHRAGAAFSDKYPHLVHFCQLNGSPQRRHLVLIIFWLAF